MRGWPGECSQDREWFGGERMIGNQRRDGNPGEQKSYCKEEISKTIVLDCKSNNWVCLRISQLRFDVTHSVTKIGNVVCQKEAQLLVVINSTAA